MIPVPEAFVNFVLFYFLVKIYIHTSVCWPKIYHRLNRVLGWFLVPVASVCFALFAIS